VEIDNVEEMKNILEKAGFTRILTLTKERKMGKLREFEINLDRVRELGNYVEIALESDRHDARKDLIDFIKELGFTEGQIEHRGYAAIIWHSMGIKFEGTQG